MQLYNIITLSMTCSKFSFFKIPSGIFCKTSNKSPPNPADYPPTLKIRGGREITRSTPLIAFLQHLLYKTKLYSFKTSNEIEAYLGVYYKHWLAVCLVHIVLTIHNCHGFHLKLIPLFRACFHIIHYLTNHLYILCSVNPHPLSLYCIYVLHSVMKYIRHRKSSVKSFCWIKGFRPKFLCF